MSIMRFDPFRDTFRELDRLTSQLASGTRMPAMMPMDAWRSGDAYHVAFDLPGIDPDSIELTVDRGALTLQAQRQAPFGEDEQVLIAERPQGSFTRHLALSEGLDGEQVQADYTNGVLHLTIPVKQSSQPRRIEVGQGAGQQAESQEAQTVDLTSGDQQQAKTKAGTSAG